MGLPDDSMLPDSLEEFHIPDTVSAAHYRSKVALLMEKYKGYYTQERFDGQEANVLHPAFAKQWDTLLFDVVSESIRARGTQVQELNRGKVFEMLKTHPIDTFKQEIIAFVRSVEEKVSKLVHQCYFILWHAGYFSFSFAHCICRRCRCQ